VIELNGVGNWVISKTREQKRLVHVNGETGEEWECGSTAPHIEDNEFVQWIMTVGNPGLGDVIRLSNGSSFIFGKSTVACA
jgi:hypothetical protein